MTTWLEGFHPRALSRRHHPYLSLLSLRSLPGFVPLPLSLARAPPLSLKLSPVSSRVLMMGASNSTCCAKYLKNERHRLSCVPACRTTPIMRIQGFQRVSYLLYFNNLSAFNISCAGMRLGIIAPGLASTVLVAAGRVARPIAYPTPGCSAADFQLCAFAAS